MTDLRTAAQQALEALEWIAAQKTGGMIQRKATEPITALKIALAEHYCDTHCTWADHAPGCVRAEPVQEPATLPGPGLVMCPACCSQFDPALNRAEPQEPTKQCTAHGECFGGQCIYAVLPQRSAEPEGGGNLPPPLQEPAQDHFPDVTKMVQEPTGCDHCRHPLHVATQCRVCGRVTA